mgnify:CR=1 FL=1
MADANHAYTAGEAIQLGQLLRDLDYYWFEEPVADDDWDGYLQVKAATPVPLAGGERRTANGERRSRRQRRPPQAPYTTSSRCGGGPGSRPGRVILAV